MVALALAVKKLQASGKLVDSPIKQFVSAISVGIFEGQPVLDLNYIEDSRASVDMNVVMTEKGEFVEIQGSGEESTFTESEMAQMLTLAKKGIQDLTTFQKSVLA